MDSLLCPICKEYYSGPMQLECLHSFCSLCIRTCLRNRMKCPICTQEVHSLNQLKKNILIEEIVTEFKLKYPHACEELPSLGQVRHGEPDPSESNVNRTIGSCPACNKPVHLAKINAHLDSNCKKFINYSETSEISFSEHKSQPSTSRFNLSIPHVKSSSTPAYKAQVAYDMFKTNKIKEIIREDGLTLNGTRQELINKHSRYIDLYNSNQDLSRPKSNKELVRDFQASENCSLPLKRKTNVSIESDAYLKEHKIQFDEMIETLKKRLKKEKKELNREETEKTMVDDDINFDPKKIDESDLDFASGNTIVERPDDIIDNNINCSSNILYGQNVDAVDSHFFKNEVSKKIKTLTGSPSKNPNYIGGALKDIIEVCSKARVSSGKNTDYTRFSGDEAREIE